MTNSATLEFTLRGVGDLVRHPESVNVEEAFALCAREDGAGVWYIFVLYAAPFWGRQVRLTGVDGVAPSPNRFSDKFMLVRCKGLPFGVRGKIEITAETGIE